MNTQLRSNNEDPVLGTKKSPSIIVCQHGARHRYAIPRMFDEAGILEALYTDSSASSNLGKLAGLVGAYAPISLGQLTKRRVQGIDPARVTSFDGPLIRSLARQFTKRTNSDLEYNKNYGDYLSKQMIKKGIGSATHVYSMNRSNLTFVEHAKDRGSIVDVFISPLTEELMLKEFERYPQWASKYNHSDAKLGEELWERTISLADILICPSQWVAQGVLAISQDAKKKIRIVPYGCSIDFEKRANHPTPGRILFVGNEVLRKGLHYLAQAARIVQQKSQNSEFRIAGYFPDEVTRHPEFAHLNFLGKLERESLKSEFLKADLFVLPSLSEGFASVVAEAINAGCPVIVTEESGSPIVDGREGLIVPSKDKDTLAVSILKMVDDRIFRDQCSRNCRANADFYSEQRWQTRLLDGIFGNEDHNLWETSTLDK